MATCLPKVQLPYIHSTSTMNQSRHLKEILNLVLCEATLTNSLFSSVVGIRNFKSPVKGEPEQAHKEVEKIKFFIKPADPQEL